MLRFLGMVGEWTLSQTVLGGGCPRVKAVLGSCTNHSSKTHSACHRRLQEEAAGTAEAMAGLLVPAHPAFPQPAWVCRLAGPSWAS